MSRLSILVIATLGVALGSIPCRAADAISPRSNAAAASLDELTNHPIASPPAQSRPVTRLPGHWQVPGNFVFHSPADISSWRFGVYAGIGNADTLVHVLVTPWAITSHYNPIYLVAGNFIYSAVEIPNVPLDVEMEMDLVQHFGPSSPQQFKFDVGFKHSGPLYYGPQSFQEFDIAPAYRWKWFPWNDYLDTNLRVVPFGFSYTTVNSQWEALQVQSGQTAKVLNFLMAELTFAPSPKSKWEAFVRVHHRSGINGLINHVTGGANYVTTGARVSF